MTLLPGPSSLEREYICPFNAGLPHFDSIGGRWAADGNLMHAFLEAIYNVGYDGAIDWAYSHYPHRAEALAAVPSDKLPPFDLAKWRPEVSFAYNPFTGKSRVLGSGLTRDAARELGEPDEIVGTVDLAGAEDGTVYVLDWKSGYRDVTPPENNWQVKTGLLMACRAAGLSFGKVAVVPVRWSGEVGFWEWHEMDGRDLDAHERALRNVLRRRARVLEAVAKGEPNPEKPVIGEHCHYCPAKLGCPAWLGLRAAFMTVDSIDPNASVERLGEMYTNLQQLKEVVKTAEAFLEGVARRADIPLPGGEIYGMHLDKTESILPLAAEGVLKKKYGELVGGTIYSSALKEASSIPKKNFKSALNTHWVKHLKAQGQKAQIGQVEKEALIALREGRAMSVKEVMKPMKFRPGKELLDEPDT